MQILKDDHEFDKNVQFSLEKSIQRGNFHLDMLNCWLIYVFLEKKGWFFF